MVFKFSKWFNKILVELIILDIILEVLIHLTQAELYIKIYKASYVAYRRRINTWNSKRNQNICLVSYSTFISLLALFINILPYLWPFCIQNKIKQQMKLWKTLWTSSGFCPLSSLSLKKLSSVRCPFSNSFPISQICVSSLDLYSELQTHPITSHYSTRVLLSSMCLALLQAVDRTVNKKRKVPLFMGCRF